MPIKDKQKAREYFKIYMASKRAKEKSLTVKPNSVKSENGLNPVKPSECSRCEMLENSISKFVNLCYQKEDEVEEQKRKNYQLEKKTKKLELKNISLQEINQTFRKDLDYWQEK